MATLQQKLLNKWLEQNYEALAKTMPQKDMLHSAYVTVYHIHRPYVPTAERFLELIEDAYYRHILSEFNHAMHFTLPDPLFWLYHEEHDADMLRNDEVAENTHSLSDLSASGLTKLFAFVKQNFSQDAFSIFRMAVVEQRTAKEIAVITGMKRRYVRFILDKIEQVIRKDFQYSPKKNHK